MANDRSFSFQAIVATWALSLVYHIHTKEELRKVFQICFKCTTQYNSDLGFRSA